MERSTMQAVPSGEVSNLTRCVLHKLRIVIRAAQRHSRRVRRMSGVSGAQLWLMHELAESPGLRVGELVVRLAVHQSTVSNLLEELEQRALVRRRRSAADQRVVRLSLTREGRRTVRTAPPPLRGLLPEALRQMPGRELEQLGRALDAVLEQVQAIDHDSGHQPLPFAV